MKENTSDGKAYALPRATMPGLNLEHILADLRELRAHLQQLGLRTQNTRLARYETYLAKIIGGEEVEPTTVFRTAKGGPMRSHSDWQMYLLREIHELAWIVNGLKSQGQPGLKTRLEKVIDGADFAYLDKNPVARNTQFELRIASYLSQGGLSVSLDKDTDIIASGEKQAYFVECKRVSGEKQLKKRLEEARVQLEDRMPPRFRKRRAYGCIAVDVTQVAFPHNGVTWGVTPEHCRDILQDKVRGIVHRADSLGFLRPVPGLLAYWFQLHIGSIAIHPHGSLMTRFSSWFYLFGGGDRHVRRARRQLCEACDRSAKRADERTSPSEPLELRTEPIELPAGTEFGLTGEALAAINASSGWNELAPDLEIGGLVINGEEHRFHGWDTISLREDSFALLKQRHAEDASEAELELLAALYEMRYPYKEQGK